MIQLKVYDSQSKAYQYWLDLYETQPIKLNLSIEDITNAEAKSVFSRTFKVPATPANNEFFKHAFLIDGIDYDVTVKKPAEIIVDGAEFRQGHIRLQRIFINGAQDKIDYEIIFLGETRDFSSAVGDATMCSLNITDLSHAINFENITESWAASPSQFKWDPATNDFVSQTPTLTSGLKGGDIVYPLINFGNSYDDNDEVEQASIEIGTQPSGQPKPKTFNMGPSNDADYSLEIDRFKPMIRAKRLVDEIFSNANYTFTSVFFDSDLFKQMYVSAFGNEASVTIDAAASASNTMDASTTTTQNLTSIPGFQPIAVSTTINDPSSGNPYTADGKNYTANNTVSYYTAPTTGQYTITASANWQAWTSPTCQPTGNPVAGRLTLRNNIGSVTYATGAYGGGAYGTNLTVQGLISLQAGDQVFLYMEAQTSFCQASISQATFEVVTAPGNSLPTSYLDCSYKQIDFIKDLLTTFRLVMSPDPLDARNFIIEPFVDYVASGDLYDWSDKLMREKDFVIEPLFNTQSDQIDFKHSDDGDFINLYHTQAYKNVFGYLEFDSGNELLKGTRTIETKWAPTPVTQVARAGANSRFIIPQIHTNTAGEEIIQNLPIKPKTRFLFYNGLENLVSNANHWFMFGQPNTTTALNYYPMTSYYNEWPMTVDSQVLNWNVDVPYWGDQVSGYDGLITQRSLYNTYWSGYINGLYDKDARRVTATFTLNNVDLQTFSFDDVIFVDGVYYRPEKINDAQIGVTGPVKVQLIKLLNYVPTPVSEDALNLTATPAGPLCFNGADGQITYVFSSPVDFPVSWSSSSGDSGQFNINPGLISNQTPGTYSITVTDAVGRTQTDTIVVPQSSATELSTTANITNPTTCSSTDGAVTITPVGGTSTYTILWTDGSTSFTRTGLASANYTFTVTDFNGCTTTSTVLVSCEVVIPNGDIAYIREYTVGGQCQGSSPGEQDNLDVVVIRVNSGNSPAEPTDGFYVFDGDYAMLQSVYGTGNGTIVAMDQINTCNQSDWYYDATNLQDAIRIPFDNCYCSNTNGFEFFNGTITSWPYTFVAQI